MVCQVNLASMFFRFLLSVDLDKMEQTNLRSNYSRKIFRREEASKVPIDTAKSNDKPAAASTRMDLHDTTEVHLMDDDVPPFPADLIHQSGDPAGLFKAGDLKEPLLRARVGQLIQIQCKRDDG